MAELQKSLFDIHQPHPILGEIQRRIALPSGVTPADAFVAVMGTLSRRLTLGEARHLVRAITPDVRPLIEPSLQERGEKPELFGRDELLSRVGKELHTDEPEGIVRTVILVVERYLSRLAFKHVRSQLPVDLRQMWTAPA